MRRMGIWGTAVGLALSARAAHGETAGAQGEAGIDAKAVQSEPTPPNAAAPDTQAVEGHDAQRPPIFGPGPGDQPYLQWMPPTGQLLEFGLVTGLFFPASAHNLKVATLPAEPYLSASWEIGARVGYFPFSFLGAEVEGIVSPSATQATNRSAILYAARFQAVAQLPLLSLVPFIVVGGGVLGAASQPMGHDGDPAFHFGLGAKAPVSELAGFRLDFRDTLTQQSGPVGQGALAHSFEVQLSASITLGRVAPTPVNPDPDGDGVSGAADRCPDEKAFTHDGCSGDRDHDGVLDGLDECLDEAGPAPRGCPNLDEDGDGVALPTDQCPKEKGNPPDGCVPPAADADGDGVALGQDRCPDGAEVRNGFEDEDGCPDEVPAQVTQFTGVMRAIVFEKNKAKISEESLPTLDEAAKMLLAFPSVRLEVSGHTSSEGTDAVNLKISQGRANAVREYLIQKGVAAERVSARGAGDSEPIADNATEAGREENRRIEFRLLVKR